MNGRKKNFINAKKIKMLHNVCVNKVYPGVWDNISTCTYLTVPDKTIKTSPLILSGDFSWHILFFDLSWKGIWTPVQMPDLKSPFKVSVLIFWAEDRRIYWISGAAITQSFNIRPLFKWNFYLCLICHSELVSESHEGKMRCWIKFSMTTKRKDEEMNQNLEKVIEFRYQGRN